MNKYALCAMVCGAFVGIRAQVPVPSNPQPASANDRRYVVLGCVSRETPPAGSSAAAPPRFLITDIRGDKPVVYRLDGDTGELTFHVGHSVEVSGPLSASAAGANANALILKVSTLAYLAPTCKTSK